VVGGLERNNGAVAPHKVLSMSELHICGMMTRLFGRCRGHLCLVTLALLTALPVDGGAYLPLVGPPPLRFEKAMSHAKTISWVPPVLTPPPIAVETNPIPVSINSSMPIENVVTPPPATPAITASAPPMPENLPAIPTVQPRPANDLLVVSPDMLVDYFRPNNHVKNAADVHVLAPVNFTPPPSVSMPSSQAIYNSQ
jgi:hypothetical protein